MLTRIVTRPRSLLFRLHLRFASAATTKARPGRYSGYTYYLSFLCQIILSHEQPFRSTASRRAKPVYIDVKSPPKPFNRTTTEASGSGHIGQLSAELREERSVYCSTFCQRLTVLSNRYNYSTVCIRTHAYSSSSSITMVPTNDVHSSPGEIGLTDSDRCGQTACIRELNTSQDLGIPFFL